MNQLRQGDVYLLRVASVPTAAKKNACEKGRAVLAHGEVTGHAHVLDAPAPVRKYRTTPEGARFVEIVKTVALRHEEHAAIMVTEGKWQQGFQVEDFGEEVRRVAD